MKKVLSIALSTAVVASTLLTGCGGSNGGSAETTAPAKDETTASAEGESKAEGGSEAGGDALKIAIVSSPSGVDDR